jgi:cytosine/adenosine deaminase-related metal-dependent hydrolase
VSNLPARRLRRIRNAWVCQVGGHSVRPAFADLLLEDDRIMEVRLADYRRYLHERAEAVTRAAASGRSAPAAAVAAADLDAGGRVVTPPLVNFHEHLYSRLARGWDPGRPLDNFRKVLQNLWWRLDRALDLDMVEAGASLGALEAIRAGVTVVFDHHASPGCTAGSLEVIGRRLAASGLRSVLCFETSDRYGPEGVQAALEENRRFLEAHREGEMRGLLGLHAPFTLSDPTLQEAQELVQRLGCGIHIHLAEDSSDPEHSAAHFGLPPAARLRSFGLLNPASILAHAIHLDGEDRAAIEASGAAVAYNPDSNLNNAVGLPALEALPEPVPVLCGTDGMHANPARTLKQLFLLARHQGGGTAEAFALARKVFFDQLAFVRRFFPDHPALNPGDRADFVVWEYRPATPFTPETFWGHYLYGVLESSPAVVARGARALLYEGRVPSTAEDRVAAAAALQGERLFERLQGEEHG